MSKTASKILSEIVNTISLTSTIAEEKVWGMTSKMACKMAGKMTTQIGS